jgi:hypothetical protein
VMTALDFLQVVRDRGVSLRVDGDRLMCKPAHLVKDLVDVLREHKQIIMWELEYEQITKSARYPNDKGLVKCFYCSHLQAGDRCKLSKARVDGISLLVECEHSAMRTVH